VVTVLIVDDDPHLRSLFATYVQELGLTAEEAENGWSALSLAREAPPDLILLDIEMPVMDGRKTLAWLKGDPQLREIPVIVVSGMGETEVAVQCIERGADDFLPKPPEPTLLRARILSSLEKARLRAQERDYQRQLEKHGLELEERVRQKTRKLAEANDRLAVLDRAKDDFLRLISHELRTPMTGVVAASDMLVQGEADEASRRECAQLLRLSVERLLRIVEDALLLTSIKVSPDAFSLEARPLGAIVAGAASRASQLAASHGVRIEPGRADMGWVLCEEHLLTEALASLLECAVKFCAPEDPVRITCTRSQDSVELRIRASGQTIPAAAIPKFFEVLSLLEPLTPGGDLGLGPPVAAQILRLLGGSVAVEAQEGGVCFLVSLRAAPSAEGDR
jgi:DNA-binding response OmpR family regulator